MSQGFIAANVDGLHGTGRAIAGRAASGGTAARALSSNLDSCSGGLGHGVVAKAMTGYITNDVVDYCNRFENQVRNAGGNVANVAATLRNEDQEGARAVRASVVGDTAIANRINGRTAVPE